MKVAIKYCGSCNPYIDLPRLAKHLASLASSLGFIFVSPEDKGADILVVLNGCRQACGDNSEEIASLAVPRVSVAGESINGQLVLEETLPHALEQDLREGLERGKTSPIARRLPYVNS